MPLIIVWGTLGISTTVLLEATLSYLGVGVQPPTPSWGNMIAEGSQSVISYPNQAIFPALALFFMATVVVVIVASMREWWEIATGRKEAVLHEAPYVESALPAVRGG